MIEAIILGGWKSILIALFLLAMSVASLAAALTEIMHLRREIRALPSDGEVATGSWAKVEEAVAHCRAAGFKPKALEVSVARTVQSIASERHGLVSTLASIGANAPYVGLFGTVIGIYGALRVLGIGGGVIFASDITAPVGEALVMTAIGLLVAIPAVFGYNLVLRLRSHHERLLRAYAVKVITGTNEGAHARELSQRPLLLFTRKKAFQ